VDEEHARLFIQHVAVDRGDPMSPARRPGSKD
jgi:hypothetical protein